MVGAQDEVIAFLSAPETHGGAPVRVVSTHLSHVFLVGDRAYKLKRAVRFDFADFSTAEKRRAACEAEVALNRRTAPAMYLGVKPIFATADGAHWRGEAAPCDWVVEMTRFAAGDQFDEMVVDGRLLGDHVRVLADRIAAFHATAEQYTTYRPGSDAAAVIEGLSAGLRAGALGSIGASDVPRWTAMALHLHERHRDLLEARRRAGAVRRCHGDMHLANICLLGGEPTPFDALEFNEDLAVCDVLMDLAFVLMDLIHHDADALANLCFNRYLAVADDYDGVALAPLFLSMRAAVRAMVLSMRGQDPRAHRRGQRYFDQALEHLAAGSPPRLIACGGFSGSGKSTLARRLGVTLGDRLGAVVLNSDVIRKGIAGARPEAPLPPASYTAEAADRVYARMFAVAAQVLTAGRSVVLDATFASDAERARARAAAQSAGVSFCGLWLDAPAEVLKARVKARRHDPSDATASVVERQLTAFRPPFDWTVVDASGDADTAFRAGRAAIAE